MRAGSARLTLTGLALTGLALGGLVLSGCAGNQKPAADHSARASVTAAPSSARPSSLPEPAASGSGLTVVAGHPVRFGADGTRGVSGTFALTCRGRGLIHLQPSIRNSTDLTCGGTTALRCLREARW
jgi:hypothetical protein